MRIRFDEGAAASGQEETGSTGSAALYDPACALVLRCVGTQQSLTPCKGNGLGSVGKEQLRQDMAEMRFDGVFTDVELPGDPDIACSIRQYAQNVELSYREQGKRTRTRLVIGSYRAQESMSDSRMNDGFTPCNSSKRFQQGISRHGLEQQGLRPGLKRRKDQLIIVG